MELKLAEIVKNLERKQSTKWNSTKYKNNKMLRKLQTIAEPIFISPLLYGFLQLKGTVLKLR